MSTGDVSVVDGSEGDSGTASMMRCPQCGDIYASGSEKCSRDGALLAPDGPDPLIGRIFAGRYEIAAKLGEGGMGVVYKARHQMLNRMVAIKLLLPSLCRDPRVLKRFQLEARAASSLSHGNIVTVYDCGVDPGGVPYIVMDFLEGTCLGATIDADGPLAADRAAPIFMQIADALNHAHKRGVLHRDLKPSNVMLVKGDDGEDRVKLVDFGIAKILSPEGSQQKLTATGEIFGSPCYMSPEQCLGEPLDARSDIYAFGCLMYESLTGKPPFVGANLLETIQKQINEDPEPFAEDGSASALGKSLASIVMQSLRKDPAQRFQSMSELRDALKHAIADRDDPSRQGEQPSRSTSGQLHADVPLEELIARAKAGDADCQYALADRYQYGEGVSVDLPEAIRWYERAADGGAERAENALACMYEVGDGVEPDKTRALALYRRAADRGHAVAQYNLARCYRCGIGTTQDADAAMRWYAMAANQGDPDSQLALGFMLLRGEGCEADLESASQWFKKAADQGLAEAQYRLALCFKYGDGVRVDTTKAAHWAEKAARQGSADAQVLLADLYYVGEGVNQDFGEAMKWYSLAAETGDAFALNSLGNMHYYGYGTPCDYAQAVSYYRRAAEAGLDLAQSNLAECYYNGEGAERDYGEAARLWRLAAAQGYSWAYYRLGQCHERGLGVRRDLLEAIRLHRKAAALEVESAEVLESHPELGRVTGSEWNDLIETYGLRGDKTLLSYAESFEQGLGVEKSLDKALAFYSEAAESPEKSVRQKAQKKLKDMGVLLTYKPEG